MKEHQPRCSILILNYPGFVSICSFLNTPCTFDLWFRKHSIFAYLGGYIYIRYYI